MANKLKFTVPSTNVGNSNLKFTVDANEGLLGSLYISKGKIAWRPRNGQYTHQLTWSQFGTLMEKHAPKKPGK